MIKSLSSLAGLALLALNAGAWARPLPSFDLSQLAVGTIFEWETDRGIERMTYLGHDGVLHKFHMQIPRAEDVSMEADGWYTQSGQGMRVATGGHNIIVSPHDCSNMIGHCTYTAMFSLTRMVQFEYFGVYFEDDIMMFTRRALTSEPPFYSEKMCSILDEYGAGIVTYSIKNDDTIEWRRRVNSPYEAEIDAMMARVEARCTEDVPIS